jgi:hypothetical protein
VSFLIFITSANIECILHAIVLHGTHVTPHINYAQVRVLQVFG